MANEAEIDLERMQAEGQLVGAVARGLVTGGFVMMVYPADLPEIRNADLKLIAQTVKPWHLTIACKERRRLHLQLHRTKPTGLNALQLD